MGWKYQVKLAGTLRYSSYRLSEIQEPLPTSDEGADNVSYLSAYCYKTYRLTELSHSLRIVRISLNHCR